MPITLLAWHYSPEILILNSPFSTHDSSFKTHQSYPNKTKPQITATVTSATKTAADPKSLARFDKS